MRGHKKRCANSPAIFCRPSARLFLRQIAEAPPKMANLSCLFRVPTQKRGRCSLGVCVLAFRPPLKMRPRQRNVCLRTIPDRKENNTYSVQLVYSRRENPKQCSKFCSPARCSGPTDPKLLSQPQNDRVRHKEGLLRHQVGLERDRPAPDQARRGAGWACPGNTGAVVNLVINLVSCHH